MKDKQTISVLQGVCIVLAIISAIAVSVAIIAVDNSVNEKYTVEQVQKYKNERDQAIYRSMQPEEQIDGLNGER